MKPLYFCGSSYQTWIGDTVTSILASLEKSLSFDPSEDVDSANPTALVFCMQLVAEHWNMMGEFEKALAVLDRALLFAPTNAELYMIKGRILKDSGDLLQASTLYEEARKLDQADRYMNTRAVKAAIRVDDIKKAQPTMILFSRDLQAEREKETGTAVAETNTGEDMEPLKVNYKKVDGADPPTPATENGEAASNIHDMQGVWYECEIGRSFMRQRVWGRAVRYFQSTCKHIQDMQDDQFDFHGYCNYLNIISLIVAKSCFFSALEYK